MKNKKIMKEEVSLLLNHYQTKLDVAKGTNAPPKEIEEIQDAIKRLQTQLSTLNKPSKRGRKPAIRPEPLPDIMPKVNMPIPISDIPDSDIIEIDNLGKAPTDPLAADWLPLKRWVDFVLKALPELDMPMTTKQLLTASIPVFDLNEDNIQRAKASIARALHKLSNKDKVIKKYPIIGKRGYNYCMPEWFNNKGELKGKYLKKIH